MPAVSRPSVPIIANRTRKRGIGLSRSLIGTVLPFVGAQQGYPPAILVREWQQAAAERARLSSSGLDERARTCYNHGWVTGVIRHARPAHGCYQHPCAFLSPTRWYESSSAEPPGGMRALQRRCGQMARDEAMKAVRERIADAKRASGYAIGNGSAKRRRKAEKRSGERRSASRGGEREQAQIAREGGDDARSCRWGKREPEGRQRRRDVGSLPLAGGAVRDRL